MALALGNDRTEKWFNDVAGLDYQLNPFNDVGLNPQQQSYSSNDSFCIRESNLCRSTLCERGI